MIYPFCALVGQEELKLALRLIAVEPKLGGVLIRGDKGAAKSTAARALAELLPKTSDNAAPFINLPLGVTEDRIVGTLDLDEVLKGKRRLVPGLLKEADGGVLYVDEVNLLADHLVDLLLDAAAMGVNRVQREGLSVTETTRFSLIGTMNPEEGHLRPQFLDRFGLCIDISTTTDINERAEIVRRRLAFELNPDSFIEAWQDTQTLERERLKQARDDLTQIHLADALFLRISQVCQEASASSLRADLVMARAAKACAALEKTEVVTLEHIDKVAAMVLRHRQEDNTEPLPKAKDSQQNTETPQHPSDQPAEQNQQETSRQDANQERHFPTAPNAPKRKLPKLLSQNSKQKQPTPKSKSRPTRNPNARQLSLSESILNAVERADIQENTVRLKKEDLRYHESQKQRNKRYLIVIDSSGSLAARKQMSFVKAAVADLVRDVCSKDALVSLVVFRAEQAKCILPWTKNVNESLQSLEAIPTGGRTPLAQALELSRELTREAADSCLILFSDGKANVALRPNGDPWQDALKQAHLLKKQQVIMVDTQSTRSYVNRSAELAQAMGAVSVSLNSLN